MIDIEARIAAIKSRIQQASTKKDESAGEVVLVAVSKKQSIDSIKAACLVGQRHFGENYVQEAVVKIEQLQQKSLIWHFLGPIQSNKARLVAEHFDWVHSIDRLKIAQRLSNNRPASMPPLNVCLQVNIDADPAKSGLAPGQCMELAAVVAELPGLRLRGLMALPVQTSNSEQTRASFRAMRQLFETLRERLPVTSFDSLSMGMSSDMDIAIEEGASMVRVGTAIFGPRSP